MHVVALNQEQKQGLVQAQVQAEMQSRVGSEPAETSGDVNPIVNATKDSSNTRMSTNTGEKSPSVTRKERDFDSEAEPALKRLDTNSAREL